MVQVVDLRNSVGAIFSEDRQYRYALWRNLESYPERTVMYIGLNPSTANEHTNDNTIKKLIKITKSNGYGGFIMMNLFALVSTDPKALVTHPDPIGANDDYLKELSRRANSVVFCWGSFKQAYSTGRAVEVMNMFPGSLCIRRSKLGRPWHPLYCYDNEQFIKF